MKIKRHHTLIGSGSRSIRLDYIERNTGQPDAQGCYPWTGMTNNIGYPFIPYYDYDQQRGRMMLGTRALLMITLGRDIAPGHNANHSCHNRWCMNPDHISEGTQQEKMHQMQLDQRLAHRVRRTGAYNHQQVNRTYQYSPDDIQFIRTADLDDIVLRFGCTRARARGLRHRMQRGYRWLPAPDQ